MTPPINIDKVIAGYSEGVHKLTRERYQLGLSTPIDVKVRVWFTNNHAGAAGLNKVLFLSPLANEPSHESFESDYQTLGIFQEIEEFFNCIKLGRKLGNLQYDDTENFAALCGQLDFSRFRNLYDDPKDYVSAAKHFFAEGNTVLSYFFKYKDLLEKTPSEKVLGTIGHELDHLDFYEKNPDILSNMGYCLEKAEKARNLEEEAYWLQEHTEIYFLFNSETEVRAHFFQYFRQFSYDWKNLKTVSNLVEGDIEDDYVYGVFAEDYIKSTAYSLSVAHDIQNEEFILRLSIGLKGLFNTGDFLPDDRKIRVNALKGLDVDLVEKAHKKVHDKLEQYSEYCKKLINKIYLEYNELRMNNI